MQDTRLPKNLMTVKVDGQPLNITLKGFNTRVNCHSTTQGASRNPYAPTADIYLDRLDSIFAAGQRLALGRIKANELNQFSQKVKELYERSLRQVRHVDPNNAEAHKAAVKQIAEATVELAKLFKEAEATQKVANVHSSKDFEADWLSAIQQSEYKILSRKQRPTILNIYPDGHGGYMISYAKPLSNVSSLDRKGSPPVLPNFWKCETIHTDSQGNELSRREFYRSSSLAPLAETDSKKRLQKAREIARFEMQCYAIEQIKKGIETKPPQTQEELNDLLRVSLFNLSLQSTIYGEGLPIAEADKIYKELEKEGLTFNAEQLIDINATLKQENCPVKVDEKSKISAEIIFMNLGTNVIRGSDPSGQQNKINNLAKQRLQDKLIDVLKKSDNKDKLTEIIQALRKKNPADKNTREQIEKFIEKHSGDKALSKELDLLSSYVRYAQLNSGSQSNAIIQHAKNHSKYNYVQQEFVLQFAEKLGCTIKFNCQSGKDRTGAMATAIEAMQIQRDYTSAVSLSLFWEKHFPHVMNYTTSREIPSINCPGAHGLQAMHFELILPQKVRSKINAKLQDRVSRLHKAPYNHCQEPISNIKDQDAKHTKVYEVASQFDSPAVEPQTLHELLNQEIELVLRQRNIAKHGAEQSWLEGHYPSNRQKTNHSKLLPHVVGYKPKEKHDDLTHQLKKESKHGVTTDKNQRVEPKRTATNKLPKMFRMVDVAATTLRRKIPGSKKS